MKFGTLKQQIMKSPLESQAVIRPKIKPLKKLLTSSILLTSLVDAFSILVIYLIVNTSSTPITDSSAANLPRAAHTNTLERGVIVRIEDNKYFVENKPVLKKYLVRALLSLRKKENSKNKTSLIIQSNRNSSFEDINPILVSGAASGFSKIKFAVIRKAKK